MPIKKRILLITAMLGIFGAVLLVAESWLKPPELSEPVAWVNGVQISFKALQREVKKARDNYAMQNIFPDRAELKQLNKEILERLIEREILWQQAVDKGLVVNEQTVSAELERMKRQYVNAAILNNMLKNRDMSQEEFLGSIKRDLTIQALIERKIARAVTIPDRVCEDYYRNNLQRFEEPEKIRASHICIFVNGNAPDEKRRATVVAMQALERRLQQGEAFEDLAREASQCASSERGGDLGYLARGAMDPEFEKAAFALKLNEVSPIVESSMGYHIIKVTDRLPARVMRFDEVKQTVARQLKEEAIERGLEKYLAELMKQADVRRLL